VYLVDHVAKGGHESSPTNGHAVSLEECVYRKGKRRRGAGDRPAHSDQIRERVGDPDGLTVRCRLCRERLDRVPVGTAVNGVLDVHDQVGRRAGRCRHVELDHGLLVGPKAREWAAVAARRAGGAGNKSFCQASLAQGEGHLSGSFEFHTQGLQRLAGVVGLSGGLADGEGLVDLRCGRAGRLHALGAGVPVAGQFGVPLLLPRVVVAFDRLAVADPGVLGPEALTPGLVGPWSWAPG